MLRQNYNHRQAEIGEPEIDSPDKGKVVCAVRCTPIADDAFMGRDARDVNVQLSADLHRIIHLSNTIDLKGLGIIPGKSCWVINIDCSVLGAYVCERRCVRASVDARPNDYIRACTCLCLYICICICICACVDASACLNAYAYT